MIRAAERLLALSLLAAPGLAGADPVRVGLIAGDPMALTVVLPLAPAWALEASLGASPGESRSAVAALVMTHDLIAPLWWIQGGGVVPTVGLGTRVALTRAVLATDEASVRFGVRAPIGLAWRQHDDGLELYLELAPGVELADPPRLSFEGGAGVRVAL